MSFDISCLSTRHQVANLQRNPMQCHAVPCSARITTDSGVIHSHCQSAWDADAALAVLCKNFRECFLYRIFDRPGSGPRPESLFCRGVPNSCNLPISPNFAWRAPLARCAGAPLEPPDAPRIPWIAMIRDSNGAVVCALLRWCELRTVRERWTQTKTPPKCSAGLLNWTVVGRVRRLFPPSCRLRSSESCPFRRPIPSQP